MTCPSSQIVAAWVKDALCETAWQRLEDLCLSVVVKRWPSPNNDAYLEFVEQNLPFIAQHLRKESSEYVLDGKTPIFEIDNEPRPYIRLLQSIPEAKDILFKLRSIDPKYFEQVCAEVLKKLGADAQTIQLADDGGVDFFGFDLTFFNCELALPRPCKACVIGQAKRHKSTNTVNETKVREFIGAATRGRHQFLKDGRLGALTPVIYEFWTTSSFDKGAKQFGRDIGMWYMEGLTLAPLLPHQSHSWKRRRYQPFTSWVSTA